MIAKQTATCEIKWVLVFISTKHTIFSLVFFPPLGSRKGWKSHRHFFVFFFNLLILLFQLATTVSKAEREWKSHPCCFLIFLFFSSFFGQKAEMEWSASRSQSPKGNGLSRFLIFLFYLFWWNGIPPNFFFPQLATTVGKSALDVASAAMTAQDKITAAAMAAPAKIYG
jgi:hypothetical protein